MEGKLGSVFKYIFKKERRVEQYTRQPNEMYKKINIKNNLSKDEEIVQLRKEVARLREMAFVNGMSKLPNKEAYNQHISRLQKKNVDYSVVVCDLNDLKYMNDNYGHKFADEVIKVVAKRLKNIIRENENDFVSHWGGDEFVLVFEEGKDVCKRIVRRIQPEISKPVSFEGKTVDVTLSMGIGSTGMKKCPFELADKAMYINKVMLKKNIDFNYAEIANYNDNVLRKVNINIKRKKENLKLVSTC